MAGFAAAPFAATSAGATRSAVTPSGPGPSPAPPAVLLRRLSTHAVKTQLRYWGYRRIGKVRLKGSVYVVTALDHKGRAVKLVVDPETAHILRRILLD